MRIIIQIDTENDAFSAAPWYDCRTFETELRRVLDKATDAAVRHRRRLTQDAEAMLFDINGNRCGFMRTERGHR